MDVMVYSPRPAPCGTGYPLLRFCPVEQDIPPSFCGIPFPHRRGFVLCFPRHPLPPPCGPLVGVLYASRLQALEFGVVWGGIALGGGGGEGRRGGGVGGVGGDENAQRTTI